MNRQSFRASRGRGGGGGEETESKQELRVENGTTDNFLSLII